MADLTLHYHPLSSFCWKALIALYETVTPFEANVVDLGDAEAVARLRHLWPMTLFPVLVDAGRDKVVPEATLIVEYLDAHHPGATRFLPEDADAALDVRLWGRTLDNYVHVPMQKITGDWMRAADARDPVGVAQARARMRTAYDLLETRMAGRDWIAGDFGLADCAAAPSLHYANRVEPLGEDRPRLAAYLQRLEARSSFARVLEEARPYAHFFPKNPDAA